MNIIGIWLATTIISIIYEFKNEFKMFKDFADIGYKLNINKMKNIQADLPIQTNNHIYLSMIVPFYNLYTVLKRIKTYEDNKQLIYETYNKLDVIEEMTDEEKQKYAENPTAWNAILLTAQSQEEKQQTELKKEKQENNNEQIVKIIVTEEDGQTNTVKLKLNKDPNDDTVKVLEIDGPIRNLPKEEITKFILNHMDQIMTNKNISIIKTNEYIQITLNKTKPKTKLERYKELKNSLIQNGFLYGEEMVEYKDLQEELKLTLK